VCSSPDLEPNRREVLNVYILQQEKRSSVKIRIDGRSKNGAANGCRQITVVDTTVEEVEKLIRDAIAGADEGGKEDGR